MIESVEGDRWIKGAVWIRIQKLTFPFGFTSFKYSLILSFPCHQDISTVPLLEFRKLLPPYNVLVLGCVTFHTRSAQSVSHRH